MAIIQELCDDPILTLFVGEGIKDMSYQRAAPGFNTPGTALFLFPLKWN